MLPDFLPLLAQADAAPQPGGFGLGLLMPVLLIVMFYFMLIRPQRRQQLEHQKKIASLRTGDECVAAGGIHGLVTNVTDRTITLRIAENVKIKVEKSSVLSITRKSDAPDEPAPEAESDVARS